MGSKSHKANQNTRKGREDLCCFAIHDRSLLIPTDSMTILLKPKQTHFWVPRLPPGYQSLSCLKVWHSWAHPSLAPMRRDTYSLFANSPVRNHHCLSPLALTILSQHFSRDSKLRRQPQDPTDWQVIQQEDHKMLCLPLLSNLFLNWWEWHYS